MIKMLLNHLNRSQHGGCQGCVAVWECCSALTDGLFVGWLVMNSVESRTCIDLSLRRKQESTERKEGSVMTLPVNLSDRAPLPPLAVLGIYFC